MPFLQPRLILIVHACRGKSGFGTLAGCYGHLLHNGGSATVVLPTHRRQCIVIPQEATYELQNRSFVYRVINGKTKATPVTLFSQNNGKEYIVEQGLNVGDTIIAEGAGLLKDGIEVRNEERGMRKEE